jgi:hypothetical protein
VPAPGDYDDGEIGGMMNFRVSGILVAKHLKTSLK